jgi:hypothetical protein
LGSLDEEASVRWLFTGLDISQEAKEIVWSAFSDSTLVKYKTALRLWVRWCRKEGVSILSHDAKHLASALAWCNSEGKSARQCENVRSAVSTIVGLHTGVQLGTAKLTSLIIRGLHKLQQARPRYSSVWDSDILHRYLESLGEDKRLLSVTLAAKLASLLLLHCYVRFTEMASIPMNKVVFIADNDVKFSIISKTDQLRTTWIQATAVSPPVAAKRVCLCMREYVNRLHSAGFKCTAATPLLTSLDTGLPYQPEKLRDMAKALMGAAGIDTVRFTAYSLKAAGLSGRASDGTPVAQLENAARLSHKSGTLRKYYLKPVTKHTPRGLPKLSSGFLP